MDSLPKVMFYFFCFRMVSPFFRHRYRVYPLYFILMGSSIFVLLSTFLLLADRELVLLQFGERNPEGKNKLVSVPFFAEAFLWTNVSMTTIGITGILCFIIWAEKCLHAACRTHIIPMLQDFLMIERELWSKEIDLRSRVPREEHRSAQ